MQKLVFKTSSGISKVGIYFLTSSVLKLLIRPKIWLETLGSVTVTKLTVFDYITVIFLPCQQAKYPPWVSSLPMELKHLNTIICQLHSSAPISSALK
jgi:hypothetical protein